MVNHGAFSGQGWNTEIPLRDVDEPGQLELDDVIGASLQHGDDIIETLVAHVNPVDLDQLIVDLIGKRHEIFDL